MEFIRRHIWNPLFSIDLILAAGIRNRPLLKYAIAVLLPFLLAGIQAALWSFLKPIPFSLLYPAVILASVFGCFGCGVIATFVSVFIAYFYFMEPHWSLAFQDHVELLRLWVIGFNSLFIAGVTSVLFERYYKLAQSN